MNDSEDDGECEEDDGAGEDVEDDGDGEDVEDDGDGEDVEDDGNGEDDGYRKHNFDVDQLTHQSLSRLLMLSIILLLYNVQIKYMYY